MDHEDDRMSLRTVAQAGRNADFMIISVAGPSMRGKPGSGPKSARQAVEQDKLRPRADQLHSDGQGLLRRTARDLTDTISWPASSSRRSSRVPAEQMEKLFAEAIHLPWSPRGSRMMIHWFL